MRLLIKKVEIEEITLCDPFITVIKNRKGEMNLSTIGPKTPATSSPEQLEAPSQPTGNPLQVLALLRWTASLSQRHHPLSRRLHAKADGIQGHDLEVLLKSVHLGETQPCISPRPCSPTRFR
jgi:AsmA protein